MVKIIETSRDAASDAELLRALVSAGCEDSFAALVRKDLCMVPGIATRRTGQRTLAGEIAQGVFTILAREAPLMKVDSSLSSAKPSSL